MVGSAGVEQGCRSNSSDVGGEGPTDALLAEPREPGQSRQQSVPYAQGRDSQKRPSGTGALRTPSE